MYPDWGFYSIRSKLIKLASWIVVIDHYFMNSTLCEDQLVNFLQIEQWVFVLGCNELDLDGLI